LATVAKFKGHYERAKSLKNRKEESFLDQLNATEEAAVMDKDTIERSISMPKNFADLTRSRRELARNVAIPKDPKVVEIEAKLNDPVSLNFDKQPLGEVLDYLRNYTGLNIVPDMKALQEEGLTLSSPVSLSVKDIKLMNALKLILQPLHLTTRA